jgi:FKBP-type peptidyl-prolyl cis-trans isomerase FkpA
MKSNWRLALLTCGLLAVWGCGPPVVTKALPPGVEPLPAPVPEDQQAEALGETGELESMTPTNSVSVIPLAPPTEPGQAAKTEGGVAYETIKPGTGEQAESGKTAVIHYVLTLGDGTKVEDSHATDQPFSFRIGGAGAIAGMQQGVAGMKVGEVRKLTIPPELGYGAGGNQKIPPNSTLTFQVELMEVK